MKLDKESTKKVAKLANLPIKDDELDKYSQQLSAIIDYVDQLQKVDTSEVEPSYNVSLGKSVMRDDEVLESLPQGEVLKNTSNKERGYFVTKGVFHEE